MKINWFPGHMNSALLMMEKELKNVDLIVYVLDSRAPFSCLNPSFDKIASKRPVIYVLSKVDLANETTTQKFKNYFAQKENCVCVTANSTISGSANIIKSHIKNMLTKKAEWNKRKGLNIPFRAMVIGVPNCGKSTLINNLVGKNKTVTGDRPGVTRGKQWVAIDDNINLLDTPGTLWPDLANDVVAHRLAYIGSIKNEVLDVPSLALDFLQDFMTTDKTVLENRYAIKIEDDEMPIQVFDKICLKRGFIARGKEIDYERGANAILDDFKKGRMGRITLDEID
ncbi:MAG: ribosome biogenesis GTPase YlqF [Christensenellales bacterium]